MTAVTLQHVRDNLVSVHKMAQIIVKEENAILLTKRQLYQEYFKLSEQLTDVLSAIIQAINTMPPEPNETEVIVSRAEYETLLEYETLYGEILNELIRTSDRRGGDHS